MSKVLKTAALVVGAAALAITTAGVGLAVASGASLASGIGLAGSIVGISAGTLSAIGAGLSLAATLTASKPTPSVGGTQTEFQPDPDAGIPYAIGRTYVAGNIVHQASWGSKNEYLSFVLVWSGAGPIEGYESFKVDQAVVNFSGQAATGDYAGYMWLDRQFGATPEGDALFPPVIVGGSPLPGWGVSSKLSGYAAGLWTIKYDKNGKKYAAGIPRAGVVLKGVKAYDARLDSTYPGGSGACRPSVESTYVYSENGAVHALTWALGRIQNGQIVLGGGQKFDSIDVAAFVEAANVADANGWKCGGVVTSDDDKYNVLKMMLQAAGAEPIRLGATLSCIVNTPRVSLGTITTNDLTGTPSIVATGARRDRINAAIPRFRSEDHDWEVIPGSPVIIAPYVTFDGRRRTRSLELPLVQSASGGSPTQAAQLAAYEIYNSREIPAITLPLRIRFIGVKPGDAWTLNIPELGLFNQLATTRTRTFEVASATPTLVFRSETTDKHAAALGKTTTPPPTPSVGLPDPTNIPAPAVGAWSAVGATLTANGASIPAIVITGTSDNPSAESVVFEYRLHGTSNWTSAGTDDASIARMEITGLTPNTEYDVAISYRVRSVVGTRQIIGPLTAGDFSVSTALGVNQIVNSEFVAGLKGHVAGWDGDSGLPVQRGLNLSSDWYGVLNVAYATIVGTPAAGKVFDGCRTIVSTDPAQLRRWAMVVSPGDRLYFAMTMAGHRCHVYSILTYFDAAGTELSPSAVFGEQVNASTGEGDNFRDGDPANAHVSGGFATVPAGAKYAAILARGVSTGAANPYLFWSREFLAKVDPAQTIPPIYGIGPGDRAADVTGESPDFQALLATVIAIGADSVLSRGEKPGASLQWTNLYTNWTALDAKAASLGIAGSERSAANSAMTALAGYLVGLSPAWNDATTDTAISASTWQTLWSYAYTTVATLQAAIQGQPGAPGINALTISCSPGNITVPCYSNGTPKATVPGFQITITQGGSDVTSSATYGSITSAGIAGASVNSSGTVTISGMTADTGYVSVPVSHASASGTARVEYSKSPEGGAFAEDEDTTISTPGGSYGEVARDIIRCGPNGTFKVAWYVSAVVTGGASAAIDGYAEWSLNGSTWTSISGTSASSGSFPPGEGLAPSAGAAFSGSSIGLTAKQDVYVRLILRRTGAGGVSISSGSLKTEWNG